MSSRGVDGCDGSGLSLGGEREWRGHDGEQSCFGETHIDDGLS